jgi:hypothetical protein
VNRNNAKTWNLLFGPAADGAPQWPRACARALSDRLSLLKDEYSPAAGISPLAAAQNTALRIGVLLYPFNPATAGQELLHGLCLLGSAMRRLSNRHYGGSA